MAKKSRTSYTKEPILFTPDEGESNPDHLAIDDWRFKEVQAVLERANRAIPKLGLSMPRVQVSFAEGTRYDPVNDRLVLGKELYASSVSEAERQAAIGHELGHKVQAMRGQLVRYAFDADAHAKQHAPKLKNTCGEAGISEEKLRSVLPNGDQLNSSTLHTLTKRPAKPELSFNADMSMDTQNACRREMDRFYSALPKALKTLQSDFRNYKYRMEFGADQFSKTVNGAQPLANYLATRDEQPSDRHPGSTERIQKLGCKAIEVNADEAPIAICPPAKPLPKQR